MMASVNNSTTSVLDFNFTVSTFCVTPLWDVNLTWYPSYGQPPDFTQCVHKTALAYIPPAFLLLLSPIEFFRNNKYSNHSSPIPWAWLNILKLITKFFLCVSVVLKEIDLSLIAHKNVAPVVGADFVGPVVRLAAFLMSISMMLQ